MSAKCDKHRRPVMKGYHAEGNEYLLYQPRCKQWNCRYCANINRLLWMAKIAHGYEKYVSAGITGWAMITITQHERIRGFEQSRQLWPKQWAKLSTRMRRAYGRVRYVIIPEHHSDGALHYHLIASHSVERRWLKDNARQCGLGYMQDVEQIHQAMAAIGYVSKYITKQINGAEWPQGMRRISTSQNWPRLPVDKSFVRYAVDWYYWLSYPSEGLAYLAHENEELTGVKTRVLGQAK